MARVELQVAPRALTYLDDVETLATNVYSATGAEATRHGLPSGSGFLTVYNAGSWGIQTYQTWGLPYRLWTRRHNGGVFTDWVQTI